MVRKLVISAIVLALAAPAAAQAHAKLLRSDPANGGVARDKTTLKLTFSETLSGKLSGADVKDAAGNKVDTNTITDRGATGLIVMVKQPLKPGGYKLDWHAVASDDVHRTTGSLGFKVN